MRSKKINYTPSPSHFTAKYMNHLTYQAWQTQMNDPTREFEILDNILSYQAGSAFFTSRSLNSKWYAAAQKIQDGNKIVPMFSHAYQYTNMSPKDNYETIRHMIDQSDTCMTTCYECTKTSDSIYEICINKNIGTLTDIIVDVPVDCYKQIENVKVVVSKNTDAPWVFPNIVLPWILEKKHSVVSMSIAAHAANKNRPAMFNLELEHGGIQIEIHMKQSQPATNEQFEKSIVCRVLEKAPTDQSLLRNNDGSALVVKSIYGMLTSSREMRKKNFQNCMGIEFFNERRTCALLIRCVGNVDGFGLYLKLNDNHVVPMEGISMFTEEKSTWQQLNFPSLTQVNKDSDSYALARKNIIPAASIRIGRSTPKEVLFPEMPGTPPWQIETDPNVNWYCLRLGSPLNGSDVKHCKMFSDKENDSFQCNFPDTTHLFVFAENWEQKGVQVEFVQCARNWMLMGSICQVCPMFYDVR